MLTAQGQGFNTVNKCNLNSSLWFKFNDTTPKSSFAASYTNGGVPCR